MYEAELCGLPTEIANSICSYVETDHARAYKMAVAHANKRLVVRNLHLVFKMCYFVNNDALLEDKGLDIIALRRVWDPRGRIWDGYYPRPRTVFTYIEDGMRLGHDWLNVVFRPLGYHWRRFWVNSPQLYVAIRESVWADYDNPLVVYLLIPTSAKYYAVGYLM